MTVEELIEKAMSEHSLIISPFVNQDLNWFCSISEIQTQDHFLELVEGETLEEVVQKAYKIAKENT